MKQLNNPKFEGLKRYMMVDGYVTVCHPTGETYDFLTADITTIGRLSYVFGFDGLDTFIVISSCQCKAEEVYDGYVHRTGSSPSEYFVLRALEGKEKHPTWSMFAVIDDTLWVTTEVSEADEWYKSGVTVFMGNSSYLLGDVQEGAIGDDVKALIYAGLTKQLHKVKAAKVYHDDCAPREAQAAWADFCIETNLEHEEDVYGTEIYLVPDLYGHGGFGMTTQETSVSCFLCKSYSTDAVSSWDYRINRAEYDRYRKVIDLFWRKK